MIYYTVDGSEPTLDSAHGSSPLALVVPGDVTGFTIKAFAKTASSAAGPVATAIYTTIANPAVRIHEILAVPTDASQLRDENGLAQDWIELRNDMAVPISIAGWTLTDNAGVPAKWTFPATASIPAGGFYLVFASGTGASPFGGIPHTNFSLGQGGERLRLIRPDGVVASQVDFPAQYPNVTWGASPDGVASGWLLSPTPGAPNSALAAGGACEVSFSVPHGFFTSAFPLTLAPSVAGATIHYTLDGSTPTTSSPVYDGPLAITPVAGTTKSGTRIVRAMATHPAVPWCPVASQTYLFVQGVAGRDTDGIIGQTQLIASIKNHATYGPLLEDAFLALPAVSIVSSASDLPYEETASSIELFAPDGREAGFTIPAGLERTGTTSINFAKASLSAKFRGKYGATSLKYPVFAGYPHAGNGAATEFQELRIRSGSHDTHQFLGTAGDPFIPYRSITRSGDAQYIRNIWIDDMQFLMGQPGKHGRMVHLFFNGSYYGIYHLHERPDENHMAAYFPGKAEDYHYTVSARSGSTHGAESWSAPWAQLKASLADYGQAKRWVDMTNLIDYMILGFYAGNDWDWLVNHNWSAAGPRLPDRGGWKFFTQDQDMCLQDVTADNSNLSLTNKNLPDGVFGALMVHPDFQVLFRDRAYRHLFHEGALTPAKAAGYYDLRANEIQTAIIAETARWQPVTSVGPLPWDRDGEWTVERNYLMNTYFPQRSAVQMNQFRSRGWYPVEAPEISQRGGAVAPGSSISLSGPGGATIYYTLDGSDPRLPGGAVSPTALAHLNPPPQTFVAPGNDVPGQGATWRYLVSAAAPAESWKTAAHDDSSWPSGKPELGYGDGDEVTNFGSIDIDPGTPGIQRPITNYFRHSFSATADISGLTLRVKRDDGIIVYLNGQEIFRNNLPEGPVSHNTTATNAADDGEAWFTKTLGAGEFTLLTGQNLIAAEVHNSSATSSDISFDLELIGSSTASGPSVTINSPTTLKARALVGTEWSAVNEATFYLTGTQPASAANLTLTEIHYHPEGSGQGDAEFLEFTNTGETAINLDGVRIVSGVVFSFPQDIFLLPGERLVVAKDQSLFDARYRQVSSPWYFPNIRLAGLYTGSLSNAGEEIAVRDANNAAIFSFRYDDEGAWPGRADERGSSLELSAPAAAPGTLAEKSLYLGNPANWRPSAEFHGSPGRQGSGPDQRVLINEVLSAPLPPLTDFIELYNPGTSSQPMGGWFLSDTSADYRKFRIPADT
ncbi:MAG: lamin tail domain-containing protein, partial [Akkermansiaceae bacterium]|nr:lamin tail domain-containing protein [Akkermansiaceae bacterium]